MKGEIIIRAALDAATLGELAEWCESFDEADQGAVRDELAAAMLERVGVRGLRALALRALADESDRPELDEPKQLETPPVVEQLEAPPPRKRGRPRKVHVEQLEQLEQLEAPPRKRGRPRKVPVDQVEQLEAPPVDPRQVPLIAEPGPSAEAVADPDRRAVALMLKSALAACEQERQGDDDPPWSVLVDQHNRPTVDALVRGGVIIIAERDGWRAWLSELATIAVATGRMRAMVDAADRWLANEDDHDEEAAQAWFDAWTSSGLSDDGARWFGARPMPERAQVPRLQGAMVRAVLDPAVEERMRRATKETPAWKLALALHEAGAGVTEAMAREVLADLWRAGVLLGELGAWAKPGGRLIVARPAGQRARRRGETPDAEAATLFERLVSGGDANGDAPECKILAEWGLIEWGPLERAADKPRARPSLVARRIAHARGFYDEPAFVPGYPARSLDRADIMERVVRAGLVPKVGALACALSSWEDEDGDWVNAEQDKAIAYDNGPSPGEVPALIEGAIVRYLSQIDPRVGGSGSATVALISMATRYSGRATRAALAELGTGERVRIAIDPSGETLAQLVDEGLT